MDSFKINTYNIRSLIQRVLLIFSKQQLFIYSHSVLLNYWNSLLKWIKTQIQYNRRVILENFCTIGLYKQDQQKVVKLTLIDSFILKNNLKYRNQLSQVQQQTYVNVNYSAILKLLDKSKAQQKDKLIYGISTILKTIVSILLQKNNSEIDLGYLGKLIIVEKNITHQPQFFINKKIPNNNLNNANQNSSRFSKNASLPVLSVLNKIESVPSQIKNTKQNFFKNNQKNYNPLLKTTMNFENPTRRFRKPTLRLNNEMSIASSKNQKTQQYSMLAHDAQGLINTNFLKQQTIKLHFPPVIDKFSRTLASPIFSQKYNMSISGRIGSNYNIKARNLYFDVYSKCIKELVLTEQKVNPVKLKSGIEEIPATLQQEIQYLTTKNQQLKNKLQNKILLKRQSYQKYSTYIYQQISPSCVSPLRESWIKTIIQSLPINFSLVSRSHIQNLIDQMLEIINYDYYGSLRKSILDYILKQPSQMKRTGILEIYKPINQWGKSPIKRIKLNFQSIRRTKKAKQQISENLLLMPSTTSKIMKQWKKYQKVLFFNLNKNKFQPVNILYFIKKQQQKILEVRNQLRNQWLKNVASYIKEDIISLNRDKKKIYLFLKSINTLLSNQLRQLTTDSLQKYLDFFRYFKKSKYRDPQQVLINQADVNLPNQNVFLIIKLKDQNNKILFSEDLHKKIKVQILDLIDQLLIQTSQFPKIQNLFKSEKSYLWNMKKNDEAYISCYQQIEEILDKNFIEIEKTKLIYEKYSYLLGKQDEFSQWSKYKYDLKEYKQKIVYYEDLYQEILDKLPFFIKMNMILIDCTEMKKKYLEVIDNMKKGIYQNIYDNIKKSNNELSRKVENIRQVLKPKAETTAKLIQLENEIDKVKKFQIFKINSEFIQLKQWISMLYDTGVALITQENYVSIFLTANNIFTLSEKIQYEQFRITKQKQELQKMVKKQITQFSFEISKLSKQLQYLIQQFSVRKQFVNYNKSISIYSDRAQTCHRQMIHINTQQQHLGWTPTVFPDVQKIYNTLKPNQELWSLVAQVDQNIKEWKMQSIKNLNTEQIDSFLKKILERLTDLIVKLGKSHTSPLKIANQLKSELIQLQQKYLPLITIFTNKGLKQRHWQAFSKQFLICQNKQSLNLHKIISHKMIDQTEKILILQQISQCATHQYLIQKTKNKMIQQWSNIFIKIKQYKISPGFLINDSSVQSIQQLLKQHIQKTMNIKGPQYLKISQQSILQWQNWLKYTQQKCQKQVIPTNQ